MPIDPRIQEWLETPYAPEMGHGIDPQERIAKATEYSAYHLAQINDALGRVEAELKHIALLLESE